MATCVSEPGLWLTYTLAWGLGRAHEPNWDVLCGSRSFGCLVTGAETCPRFSLVSSRTHIAKAGPMDCFRTTVNVGRLLRQRTGFHDGAETLCVQIERYRHVLNMYVSEEDPAVAGRRNPGCPALLSGDGDILRMYVVAGAMQAGLLEEQVSINGGKTSFC